MSELTKKQFDFIVTTLCIIIGIAVLYFFVTTVLVWLIPFIIAYIISRITEPLVVLMEKKMKLPRKMASAISVVSALLVLGSLLTLVIYRIIYELRKLADKLPDILSSFSDEISNLLERGTNIYIGLPTEISGFFDNVLKSINNNLSGFLSPITETTTRFAYNFATSLPSILLFIVVLLLSTYFMSSDKEKISSFFKNIISQKWMDKIINIRNNLSLALSGYIKAQLILMAITFVEVSIGLFIIGIDYAILFGLIISFIDVLPILGTGTILIPWSLFAFITGNYPLGFSLIILYGVVLLVRQFLEPKIVGVQIGLHPLATLGAMYMGLKVLGIMGMILGPIIVLVVKNIIISLKPSKADDLL